MAQSLFTQNVIAVIWDFDKTLTPDYMQRPLFEHFGVDEKKFWAEANGLAEFYKRGGICNVSRDTLYLNHILTYVETGKFAGLNNRMLSDLGAKINFFEGLPEFFVSTKNAIAGTERFALHEITVEHYIVSTGLREMIMGSKIAPHVEGVWGCEFVEDVAQPGYLDHGPTLFDASGAVLRAVGYSIDNTTKTRALFEINKGSNRHLNIDVTATMAPEDRRVPFENMIYIADGPSDVPAFSIVNQYGGRTFAVYKPKSMDHFQAVERLQRQNRVQGIAEASYVEGSLAAMWITNAVQEIAARIASDREALLKQRLGTAPQHILTDIPEKPEVSRRPIAPAIAGRGSEDRGLKRTGTEGDSAAMAVPQTTPRADSPPTA